MVPKKSFFLLAFFSVLGYLGVAQTIGSRLVDAKTQKGIPYATVQYGEHQGVITNEEGLFGFVLEEGFQASDSIYISSMGYQKTGFTLEQLQDSVIALHPKAIELSGVYLFDKELSVDQIMDKVEENLPINYTTDPIKQRFFLRQSSFNTLQKLDIEFKKSTIEELNEELMDSIISILPRNAAYYTETLGDYYHGEESKLEVIKAAELYDKSNEGSMEALSDKLEAIFKANVKPDSYLKIKSGIFGEKVQVDSILEAEEETDELESELKEPEKNGFLGGRKHVLNEIHSQFFGKKSKLDVVRKLNRYKYELLGYSELENHGVYVIGFVPKGRADFKGKLFVNIEDFAIVRMDYENVKSLKSIRLLGFSYSELDYQGSTVFSKFGADKYSIKFMNLTYGRKFGVDRPLKVIEKNKHVKGPRKQNELSLELDIVNYNTEKYELVAFESNSITKSQIESLKEDETVKATYLSTYNPGFWKDYTIMEPNQAIREFTVEE